MKKTEPVAKKKHVCELCKQPIEKGQKYVNITIQHEDWDNPYDVDNPYRAIHRHIECDKAWKLISDSEQLSYYFYEGGTEDSVYERVRDGEIEPSNFGENAAIIQNFFDRSGLMEIIMKRKKTLKRNAEIVKKMMEVRA